MIQVFNRVQDTEYRFSIGHRMQNTGFQYGAGYRFSIGFSGVLAGQDTGFSIPARRALWKTYTNGKSPCESGVTSCKCHVHRV